MANKREKLPDDLDLQWADARPFNLVKPHDKTVQWRCENKHTWTTSWWSRLRGSGCAQCSGNARRTFLPQGLQAEWNDHREVKDVASTDASAEWRCSAEHIWNATIFSRLKGKGCPHCAGRAKYVLSPSMLAEWTDPRPPSQVKSNQSVDWRCALGHIWSSSIQKRREANRGCPFCSGVRRNEESDKRCNSCLTLQPPHQFNSVLRRGKIALRPYCKPCECKKNKEYRELKKLKDPVSLWITQSLSKKSRKTLSKEDVLNIIKSHTCTYCKCQVLFAAKRNAPEANQSATLDRIIPNGVYSIENCVLACFRCNAIKRDSTLKDLINITTVLQALHTQRGIDQ